MSAKRTALFPGTFDPFTNGHLDLARRALRLFDRVVVAVADSPAKGVLFPLEERVAMCRAATRRLERVEVVSFGDLVVDCARREGAQVMLRGLRAVSDFEYEFQMALMNRRLSAGAGGRVPDAEPDLHLPELDAGQGGRRGWAAT